MIGSWSCNHRGSLFHSYTEVATQKLAPRWWASWSSDDIFTVPLTSPFVVRASWPAGTGISQEKSNQPLDKCQTVPMSVFPECGLSLKECGLQGFLRGHRPCWPYWISEGQRMSQSRSPQLVFSSQSTGFPWVTPQLPRVAINLFAGEVRILLPVTFKMLLHWIFYFSLFAWCYTLKSLFSALIGIRAVWEPSEYIQVHCVWHQKKKEGRVKRTAIRSSLKAWPLCSAAGEVISATALASVLCSLCPSYFLLSIFQPFTLCLDYSPKTSSSAR